MTGPRKMTREGVVSIFAAVLEGDENYLAANSLRRHMEDLSAHRPAPEELAELTQRLVDEIDIVDLAASMAQLINPARRRAR